MRDYRISAKTTYLYSLIVKREIFVSKNNLTEERLILGCEKKQFNEVLVS